MISISQAQAYCREDITLIKNYAEAVADTTQEWICHHINGEPFTGFSRKDLEKMNMIYNRPASELKFVTRKMHEDIHGSCKKAGKSNKSKTGCKNGFYGKHHSEESRQKMSFANIGRTSPRKGATLSEETKKKISKSQKGKHHSDETKKKMSESRKGRIFSDEHRKKISAAHKGRIVSEETRKKISAALKVKHKKTGIVI